MENLSAILEQIKKEKKMFVITKFDLKNFNEENISLFDFLKKNRKFFKKTDGVKN